MGFRFVSEGESDMGYRRLPFEQYFINTSEDFNKTGLATYGVTYSAVRYSSGALEKELGIRRELNYEIHYEPDRDVIQLNFQGSIGVMDWVANLFEFAGKYYDAIEFEGEPLQLRAHRGWGDMYRAAKTVIREEWRKLHDRHPSAETEILGWSLGAGMAILCCQDLNYNFGLRPHLFTFGSVRPFRSVPSNAERMRRYLDTLCRECWNFADINDIVTYMPPFRGFMMIRRVEVAESPRRTVFRLLNPLRYHTAYDHAKLYSRFYSGKAQVPSRASGTD